MTMLYICEKPSQAKDIARHLNATEHFDGYIQGEKIKVTWCVGHLLALAPPEYYCEKISPWRIEKLPVIPEEFVRQVVPRVKKQFNIVKTLLKQADHVVIASDYDREGEAIVREILEICQYNGSIERLCLLALDDSSIKKGLKNLKPGENTEKLYLAAKSRGEVDWLFGLNGTMAISSLYGVNSVLSVGRVQTPTLKIVVDRDSTVESFKSKDYFVLKAKFTTENKEDFWATWQAPNGVVDEQGYCLNEDIVDSFAAKIDAETGVVQSFSETKKKQKVPLCFSLSSLQKQASQIYGFGAKQTLDVAQSLYEVHKATTYPRTDCGYLPEDQHNEAVDVAQALIAIDPHINTLIDICDFNFKSGAWNDKKITAHHGIIPTLNGQVDIDKLTRDELKIYDLVRRQYLAQFMGDYEYLQRQVEIQCAGEWFKATVSMPEKQGWKKALTDKSTRLSDEETDKANGALLPILQNHQALKNKEYKVLRKATKPLAHFTEGTLIDAMKTVGKLVDNEKLKKLLKESSGIGTEATRANILEILFKRGYLKRKDKQVISTEKGRALIEIVPEVLKNPAMTAVWEQALDKIAEGKLNPYEFIHQQTTILKQLLQQIVNEKGQKQKAALQLQSETKNSKVYLCAKCQAPLRLIKSRNGQHFWGCTKYPDCRFTMKDKGGKPLIRKTNEEDKVTESK